MSYEPSSREKVLLAELDQAIMAFRQARSAYDEARAKYEIAREHFIGVKKVAGSLMTAEEFLRWQRRYPGAELFGIPIAEAILAVLESQIQEEAREAADFQFYGKDYFGGYLDMTLGEIVTALERGGFEFGSQHPNREVNATLINLKGIVKTERGYALENYEKRFESRVRVGLSILEQEQANRPLP